MKRLLTILAKLEETLLCILLTAMIVLACTQIVLRTGFSGGLLWIDPVLRQLVLWAGLLGAAMATSRGEHINLDIANYLLPEKVNNWMHSFNHVFSGVVCSLLTYAAVIFIIDEFHYGDQGLLGIGSWVWATIFPFAFGLMAVQYLILTIISVYKNCTSQVELEKA